MIEDIGIINQLGYIIFEKACSHYAKWSKSGIDLNSISINISGKQFYDKDIFDKFIKITDKFNISPSSIVFEITELLLFKNNNNSNIIKLFEKFKKHGFKFTLDNFGVGGSSYKTLQLIPWLRVLGTFILN